MTIPGLRRPSSTGTRKLQWWTAAGRHLHRFTKWPFSWLFARNRMYDKRSFTAVFFLSL